MPLFSLQKIKQHLWILIAVATLSACTTTPNSQMNVEWQSHQARLDAITDYKAIGKLAYISPEEKQSLSFVWQHNQSSSTLKLNTFLGQSVLTMNITPSFAEVITAEGERYVDSNAEKLLAQLTGLSVPIAHFPVWLLGKPTQSDSYTLNTTNTLASLDVTTNQQPWQLNYQSYQDVMVNGAALPLPKMLNLIQQQTRIKISINKWQIKQASL